MEATINWILSAIAFSINLPRVFRRTIGRNALGLSYDGLPREISAQTDKQVNQIVDLVIFFYRQTEKEKEMHRKKKDATDVVREKKNMSIPKKKRKAKKRKKASMRERERERERQQIRSSQYIKGDRKGTVNKNNRKEN